MNMIKKYVKQRYKNDYKFWKEIKLENTQNKVLKKFSIFMFQVLGVGNRVERFNNDLKLRMYTFFIKMNNVLIG